MKKFVLGFFLALVATVMTAPVAKAQAQAVNVRDLVLKSCRYYRGENIQTFMDPNGGINNPLLMSPIGRLSYFKNFKSGLVETKFMGTDELIETINRSPELDHALDQCYGKNEEAKYMFLMLMNEIQYRAKSDALLLTIGSFFVQGGVLIKVAAKIPFAAGAAAWLRGIGAAKWGARLVLTYAGIVTGKALYKLIQFKRGKLKNKELELPKLPAEQKEAALAEIQADREGLDSLKAFAIRDLQQSITQLRAQSSQIKDPARRAKLEILLHESEQTLQTLKAS
jgi:hypothetical protein